MLVLVGLGDQHYSTLPLLLRDGPGGQDVVDSICDNVGDELE